jgi:predicted ATP-binding protein involved in virulence
LEIEFNDNPISWTVSKTKRGRKKQRITNLTKIKDVVEMVYGWLDQDEKASVPLAVFYGVNRSVLDIPLRIRTSHKFDQLSAYDQALTGARNDFRLFFEWYRKQEDHENEQRLYPVEHVDKGKKGLLGDLEYRDPQLQAVRKAINELTGFTNLRIRRNPLRMEVRKGKQHFDVRQLSDGEKCLLALAGDLARRLAIANPSMEDPLKGQAIILIDEVELHLHPEWQHRVIPKLKSTYLNCQFVLTSHSPQVLSNVNCKGIWCLVQGKKGMKAVRPDGTFGQDSNFLLKTLMGTSYRPSIIEKNINRLFDLIRKDVKKARMLLEKVSCRKKNQNTVAMQN